MPWSQLNSGIRQTPTKAGSESNQRLLNGYAEALGQAAKSPLPIYAVPGTSRFDTGTTGLNGPCRGMLYVYGKGLYVIAGTAAALFDDQGNATPVSGTIGGTLHGHHGGQSADQPANRHRRR